jgi:hypothetical protein
MTRLQLELRTALISRVLPVALQKSAKSKTHIFKILVLQDNER